MLMLKNYLNFENLGADFVNLSEDVRSGIPSAVIERAKQILKETEENGTVTYKTVKDADSQLPLEMANAAEILDELKALDVNTLTPIEAMGVLFDIANKAKSV